MYSRPLDCSRIVDRCFVFSKYQLRVLSIIETSSDGAVTRATMHHYDTVSIFIENCRKSTTYALCTWRPRSPRRTLFELLLDEWFLLPTTKHPNIPIFEEKNTSCYEIHRSYSYTYFSIYSYRYGTICNAYTRVCNNAETFRFQLYALAMQLPAPLVIRYAHFVSTFQCWFCNNVECGVVISHSRCDRSWEALIHGTDAVHSVRTVHVQHNTNVAYREDVSRSHVRRTHQGVTRLRIQWYLLTWTKLFKLLVFWFWPYSYLVESWPSAVLQNTKN